MKILVADDDFATRQILSFNLIREGFDVVVVEDGSAALEILQKEDAPKMAVLDWQMPGLTGIEVIKALRQAQSDYVYCLLLTAKSELEDFEIGFEAGADDFLTKPIDIFLIKQKLRVAKRLIQYELDKKKMQVELVKYADSMKILAEERAVQLVHADRLVTLGTLAAGMAHEINNPTTFIAGNAQSLEKYWDVLIKKECFSANEDPQVAMALEHFPKMISGIRSGVTRITKIVSSLKSYARQDLDTKKAPFDIREVIEDALEICYNKIKHNITIEKDIPEAMSCVLGDRYQIEQVLVNLITNAADAMNGQKNSKLSIYCHRQDDMIYVHLQDNGPGVADDFINKIFNPFFTSKSRHDNTGLGLSISKGIVEEHKGQLDVKNAAEGGAIFTFSIPLAENYSEETN